MKLFLLLQCLYKVKIVKKRKIILVIKVLVGILIYNHDLEIIDQLPFSKETN